MDPARFNNKTYKSAHICFTCRKVFKRKALSDIVDPRDSQTQEGPAKCPQCGQSMTAASSKLRVPPVQDTKAWAVLGLLNEIEALNEHRGLFGGNDGLYTLPNGPVAARRQLEVAIAFFEANQQRLMNAPEQVRGDSMKIYGRWLVRAKELLRTV